jgi:predicted transcriptional regulator
MKNLVLQTRLDRIRHCVAQHGPMTARQVADLIGLRQCEVSKIIRYARKNHSNGVRIRQAGKVRVGPDKLSWLYEMSDEPDAIVEPIRFEPSRQKRLKHPGISKAEDHDTKRLRQLSEQTKPFRDPMIFLTAGVAP